LNLERLLDPRGIEIIGVPAADAIPRSRRCWR